MHGKCTYWRKLYLDPIMIQLFRRNQSNVQSILLNYPWKWFVCIGVDSSVYSKIAGYCNVISHLWPFLFPWTLWLPKLTFRLERNSIAATHKATRFHKTFIVYGFWVSHHIAQQWRYEITHCTIGKPFDYENFTLKHKNSRNLSAISFDDQKQEGFWPDQLNTHEFAWI